MDADELAQVIWEWAVRDLEPSEWAPTFMSNAVDAQSLARWLLERGAVKAAA